jgi:hypothetical protein
MAEGIADVLAGHASRTGGSPPGDPPGDPPDNPPYMPPPPPEPPPVDPPPDDPPAPTCGDSCTRCSVSSDCGGGEVCVVGKCVEGYEISMYECPGMVSLGGGAWGYYGCQNQITNTPTCNEIEWPTSQAFDCNSVGNLPILTTSVAPAGTKLVDMYECPGPVSLGGGAWGFYGCQNQITNTPYCLEIEYPSSQWFACEPIGKVALADDPPSPPDGGKIVPMYRCPGIESLGGGAWGFYGCHEQLTNIDSCLAIEYPTSRRSSCSFEGSLTLLP